MPFRPFTRTATDRWVAAMCCWVAMTYRADMRPGKVSNEPGSVQSNRAAKRVRILFRTIPRRTSTAGWVRGRRRPEIHSRSGLVGLRPTNSPLASNRPHGWLPRLPTQPQLTFGAQAATVAR